MDSPSKFQVEHANNAQANNALYIAGYEVASGVPLAGQNIQFNGTMWVFV